MCIMILTYFLRMSFNRLKNIAFKHMYNEMYDFSFSDSINALVADGKKFSHPLYHLGKSTNDLPILAIDSFRHMYLWPSNPKEEIE